MTQNVNFEVVFKVDGTKLEVIKTTSNPKIETYRKGENGWEPTGEMKEIEIFPNEIGTVYTKGPQ